MPLLRAQGHILKQQLNDLKGRLEQI